MNDHWFADVSDPEDACDGMPWQPFLQIAGVCFPLPIWFATETDCVAFIMRIPAGAS